MEKRKWQRREWQTRTLLDRLLLLPPLLGSHKVVHDGKEVEGHAHKNERHTTHNVNHIAKGYAHPREVGIREGRPDIPQLSEDGHADGRQKGDEQSMDEGTGNTTLPSALGISKDANDGTAEEVR